jgi:chromosome segregation ATPase
MASPRPQSSCKRKQGVTLHTILSSLQHKAKKWNETVEGEKPNKKRKTRTPSGNSNQQCRSKLFSDQDPMEGPMAHAKQSLKQLAKDLESFATCSNYVKQLRKGCNKAATSTDLLRQLKEEANDDYDQVKYKKEADYRMITTCEEHLSAGHAEIMELKKKIDAIEAQTVTTEKKKTAAVDIAYDPRAIPRRKS